MRQGIRFTKSDYLLILLAVFMITSGSYFYFLEISPRGFLSHFFPSLRPKLLNNPVGKLKLQQGIVRRQQAGRSEFERLNQESVLYNSDTIVTSKDTSAIVMLDDGGQIELGPDTMIKLQLETQVSFDGITRHATIELVSGQVKGNIKGKGTIRTSRGDIQDFAAVDKKVSVDKVPIVKPTAAPRQAATIVAEALPDPKSFIKEEAPAAEPSVVAPALPVPSPEVSVVPLVPLTLEFKKPELNAKYSVAKGTQSPSLSVAYDVVSSRVQENSKITLIRTGKGESTEMAFEKEQPLQAGSNLGSLLIDRPGNYKLDIATQEITKSVNFEVRPSFEAIARLDPLVGGSAIKSSEYQGKPIKKFEIVLRWKPYPNASEYIVELLDAESSTKVLLKKKTKTAEYRFNKDVIFKGKFQYRITAVLESGFLPQSSMEVFEFSFRAPELTQPSEGAVVSSRGSVLLTWTKTNFTQQYEVEVFSDAQLRTKLFDKKISENFFVLKGIQAGNYYWRVRSISGTTVSPNSKTSFFIIR